VRKVLEALGLTVNRLIRVSYGPYELGSLERGDVQEVTPDKAPAKPIKAKRAEGPAATPQPLHVAAGAKPKRKAGWAKPKIKPPRSAPAGGPRAGPRGPKRSASPRQSSPARPPGPRTGGGPKRRG
jgi:23S rRNA pseudouridine2605 synthase